MADSNEDCKDGPFGSEEDFLGRKTSSLDDLDEDQIHGSATVSEEEDDDLFKGKDDADDLLSYGAALSAVAPSVTSFEENQFEVSSSPAFYELEKLFKEGLLTGTQLALLRSKYTEIHELLKSKRNKEQALLCTAKKYTNQLEQQKLELEQAENFPENCNTEVSKLRQQLLRYGNELQAAEERCEQLAYNIQCLEEEQRLLEKECSRLPKQAEIEKKQDELKQGNVDLRKEINQRKLDTKTLKEDLDNKNRQMQLQEKEIEATMMQLQQLKSDLVTANAIPHQTSKEADKLLRQKYETDKRMKEVDHETKQLQMQIQNLHLRLTNLEDEKRSLENEARESSIVHAEREKNLQILMKDYEYAKNRENDLLVDKTKLDLNLKHLQLEKVNIHEVHSRKVREKDHELRQLKKSELQLKVVQDAVSHTKQIHDKVKLQIDSLPMDNSEQQKKRNNLTKEVGQLRRLLEAQTELTSSERIKIEQSVAEEERLLYEQSDLRIEVVELTRLAAIKSDERIQKVRDHLRAEQNYQQAKDELKSKQVVIEDHKKKDLEMQIKLKDFAKMYDVIKNERNQCVSLIQISTQKAAEMREKIKILGNEMDILRTMVAYKERQLQKHRMKHTSGITVRDSLRSEVSKQRQADSELREKKEQQRMDISKLEILIKQAEQQMVNLRKRYETEVKKRNDRGIQLVERNEEVCIFYEKFNIQEQMIRNGNMELSSKEEMIRFLKMQLVEEKRQLEVMRNALKDRRAIEQEVVTLQIQRAQCQDRLMDLEHQVENPNAKNRARMIEGKDPAPLDLQNKIEELEERLATKEERSLELHLIDDFVSRLIDQTGKEIGSGRKDTLVVAKKVNSVRANIKDVTQKLMACVAELAMLQAESLQLQQHAEMQKSSLERCHIQMEKGEAPSSEMEAEWMQLMRNEERHSADKESTQITAEQETIFVLPDGSTTRAAPRPNAYMPDEEHELPIPRPYGGHAPFRPSEPGSTMRHFRKPALKPIEI